MKEEEIKKLVQKSATSTSEGFTDRLMHRLESQPFTEPVKVWSFKKVLMMVLMLIVGIGYGCYRLLGVSSEVFQMDSSNLKVPIFFITALVFLLTIRRLFLWKEMQHGLKHS